MSRWAADERKFRELVLYVSTKCASMPRFGATKLNKVLFYSDFLAYALLGKPISGFEYQKLEKGPAPRGMRGVQERMEQAGELAIRDVPLPSGKVQKRPVALRHPKRGLFTKQELEVVDRVIASLRDTDAEGVSDLSHLEVGWKAANLRETIPYGTIFLSDKRLTDEEIRRIQRFARERGYAVP